MAKSTQSNPQGEGTKGTSDGGKTGSSSREVEITSANSFAEVLDFDQKGYRIMFACEKGQFLALKETEVAQLSKFTKTVYQAMKAQNTSMEAEDPEWADIKKRLKVGDPRGSARARMAVTGSVPGMETRYFRPDNTGTAEAKGWRPASPSKYKIAGGHDGHLSIKAHGEDELVLFERPAAFRAENDRLRQEQKAARAEAERTEFKEAVERSGYRALSDGEVAKGHYKDIE